MKVMSQYYGLLFQELFCSLISVFTLDLELGFELGVVDIIGLQKATYERNVLRIQTVALTLNHAYLIRLLYFYLTYTNTWENPISVHKHGEMEISGGNVENIFFLSVNLHLLLFFTQRLLQAYSLFGAFPPMVVHLCGRDYENRSFPRRFSALSDGSRTQLVRNSIILCG